MKKKIIKKCNGFTIVELLVAVSILGIIMGMSIPIIRNIQYHNTQKKFNEYGKAMISSAKLYRDSYEEDLFGHKASGCALISLSQLMEKDLIKDFPENNITCNYEETKVRIIKINKQYGYSYQLLCGVESDSPSYAFSSLSKKEKTLQKMIQDNNGEDESVDLEESFDNPFDEFSLSTCNINSSMEIEANPNNGIEKAESYSVRIRLSSNTGISSTSSPVKIQYTWVEATESIDLDIIDYNTITNWKSLQFSKIESELSQQEKLLSSSTGSIQADSYEIFPPTTEANKWYLVLKINSFKDLTGESYPNTYEIFGIYNIAKKYTLTYDDNGGSGCSTDNKKIEKLLGKGDNDTWGKLCTPTKNNSTFVGWNTKKDGTGTKVTKNTPVTSEMKVYAQWEPSKVIIRYKLMSNETLTENTYSEDTPPKHFKWKKGNEDLIERSNDGGDYEIYTTTITFGTNRELNLANYNNEHALNIKSSSGYTAAKSGAEWICESGCKNNNQTFSHSKITINNTENICDTSNGNCTINIRVNWDPSSIPAIPVSLNQQGGSGGTATIYAKSNKWYTIGNPTASTSNTTSITKPSKAGYTFGGYFTEVGGKGTQKIRADGTINATSSEITSSTTWYAKWILNTCTINFSPNGGTFNNNSTNTTQTIKYGEKQDDFWNANGGTYDASRNGYTVDQSDAWILSNSSKTFDESKSYTALDVCSDLKNGNQTVTLNANWKAKIYVSSSGNDTTGYGSIAKPYKTISKAYSVIPNSNSTIYLTSDIVADSQITFDSNKAFNLTSCTKNSNNTCSVSTSYTISRKSNFKNGNVIYISKGSLTLSHIILNGQNVQADWALLRCRGNGAMLYIKDGTILKNNIKIRENNANGKPGGALGVLEKCQATMSGGSITNSKAPRGAGVYVDAESTFTMSGGSIYGNNATYSYGGGVLVSGIFNMTAGNIYNNKAAMKGGGVYVNSTGTFTISGGNSIIKKNNAASDGGIFVVSGGTYNRAAGTYICKNNNPTNDYNVSSTTVPKCQ